MKNSNKRLWLFLITFFSLFQSASSQITLSGSDYLSKPAGVISDIIKVEGVTSLSQLASISSNDKIRTYKYVDGFGRPLQDVVEGGSPNGKDLIQIYKYDEFGRSTKQYLPFEYTSVTSGQPYQDRSTAESNQASFYSTGTTANKIAADSKPYSQSEIEQSPMQRLIKQGNVGDGFQTDQHYKSMVYRVNVSGDGVRKWAVDGTSNSTYSANDLSVTEGTDENGVTGIVFTDKLGRTILKRQQADETIGGTGYSYFDTYYVYDLLGNVANVIPPKAVAKLASGSTDTWNITSVPNLIFSYVYDNKNRVTEKKIPGADVVYMAYDPLDRVVLVQSGTMRTNNAWFYSKYDAKGRVITEGVYTDGSHTSLSSMQSYVAGLSCYDVSSTIYYEEKTTTTSSYYTNNCFPTSGTEERLYYYYDDYDIYPDGTMDFSYESQGLPGEGTATDKLLGLPTVVAKKVLGTSSWIWSETFYDKWYHVIQVVEGAGFKYSKVTSVIDFGARLNERKEYDRFSKYSDLTVRNSYSYDKMNRLTQLKQGNNGGTMIIVGSYEYNSLGQLVDRKLHSTNSGSSYLQSVDYRYNIRGQLTSINNSSLSSDGGVTNDESNDIWGMNLFYDQVDGGISNTANYTGLLSAVKWKANVSGGNSDERAYLFSYDKLDRLTAASYKAKTGSTWTKDVDGYNETIGYDWNGNILSMKRKAVISGSVTDIDDMVYDYGSSNDNNKLVNMTENSSNSYGYRNFTSSSSGYSYDENGNLTADAKKGTTITYNELNKPVTITQTSTGKYVQYSYDAAGVRLTKTVYDGSTTTTLNYVAGVVVDANAVVQYFAMAEGRVRNNSGTLTYEYFITDQQGNVRVSFEDNGSGTAVVRQENSYYPYGMLMPGNYMPSDANKKLYNAGSDWQDDFGGIVDYYSTFFREYDPVIGRFNGVDPKAEATVELSIYHYAGNNPVNFNDPMGNEPEGGALGQWLLKFYNALPSGTYHFEDGIMTGYEKISRSTSQSILRDISNFVNNIDGLEEEVIKLARHGDYKEGYQLIIKSYGAFFSKLNNFYNLHTSGFDLGNATTPRDANEIDENNHEFIVGMSELALAWLVPENKRRMLKQYEGDEETIYYLNHLTFGDIVRGVFHEIGVHVRDGMGLNEFGSRPESPAEREFRAYYEMWTTPGLPPGKLQLYNWSNVVFGDNPKLGAYSQLTSAKQEYYRPQYLEMITYILSQLFIFK